jgi:secreted PhoX family phosphatase
MKGGGRLQCLRIRGMEGVDTSNHATRAIAAGVVLQVEWLDLENVESPTDDLRIQGALKGAARFSRAEGIWTGRDGIYFVCTSGGVAEAGQVWRYRPSRFEGTEREKETPGTLELFVEPNNESILQNADNITVAPWGDLIVCEDGPDANYLVGITPAGDLYHLGRNAMNDSELAGAAFSPDRTTLFVNIQTPGMTLAITGPWQS